MVIYPDEEIGDILIGDSDILHMILGVGRSEANELRNDMRLKCDS